ncbi:MAG: M14 family zinc carboxypeptidase [Bacteroidota bacterium]
MKHLLALLLLLILPALIHAQTFQEVKIHAAPESLKTIASMGIAVDNGTYGNGTWQTILSTTEVSKVRNAGFVIDIIHADYSKYISERNKAASEEVKEINRQIRTKSITTNEYPVPAHFELGSMGGYYTPQQVLNELDSMRLFYPTLISQKAVVGSQQTIDFQNIYFVRISNTPDQATNKPKIMYNSLIHAREPMGMQQLMFFMWYLLENYNTSPDVKYLVDNLELYFIPDMNPDGYAWNYQTDPGGGGMWRKNRRDNGGGNFGVDLNRNFGYMWAYDNSGSSGYAGDETYRGASPFSEAETQDFRDFCVAKKFKMVYDFHTYADITIYPWCYKTAMTPDSLTEYAFTDRMTAKNGYLTGPPGRILYNTNGDAMDWAYGDSILKPRITVFTTETGNNTDGFWPAPSRIIPLAEENMYANLQAARLTLPYAEVMDMGPVINPERDAYFPFQFTRLGLTDSTDYTVSVKPLDSLLFNSVGSGKVIHYPAKHIPYTDSIQYSLVHDIQIGQKYRFIWQIDNGKTILRDTVTKYYGWPMVLMSDSCNTMANWTSTKWNISNKASHSAPNSLTDSPNGSYPNNANSIVTLRNNLSIGSSPVAVVEYWVRYSIEKSMDYCQVSTSQNSGGSWVKQATRYTNNGSTSQNFPNPIYDGSRDWSQDRIVLENAAGTSLLLKFALISDYDLITGDGMYLDDFRVSVVDMTYNSIDPGGNLLGFISGPIPNPAVGKVAVNYQLPHNSHGNGSFQLLDMRGVLMKEIPLTSSAGSIKFNVADLPAGVYLYRISGGFGTTAVKKLVVAH